MIFNFLVQQKRNIDIPVPPQSLLIQVMKLVSLVSTYIDQGGCWTSCSFQYSVDTTQIQNTIKYNQATKRLITRGSEQAVLCKWEIQKYLKRNGKTASCGVQLGNT